MIKMFSAKAVDRTDGCVTLASAVFDGPVLKKRKNNAINISTQARGNGVKTTAAENGNAIITPIPDTKKYAPPKRLRSKSPAIPPRSVAVRPAMTSIPPNTIRLPGGKPRYCKYPGIQNERPPMAKVSAVIASVFQTYDLMRIRWA